MREGKGAHTVVVDLHNPVPLLLVVWKETPASGHAMLTSKELNTIMRIEYPCTSLLFFFCFFAFSSLHSTSVSTSVALWSPTCLLSVLSVALCVLSLIFLSVSLTHPSTSQLIAFLSHERLARPITQFSGTHANHTVMPYELFFDTSLRIALYDLMRFNPNLFSSPPSDPLPAVLTHTQWNMVEKATDLVWPKVTFFFFLLVLHCLLFCL